MGIFVPSSGICFLSVSFCPHCFFCLGIFHSFHFVGHRLAFRYVGSGADILFPFQSGLVGEQRRKVCACPVATRGGARSCPVVLAVYFSFLCRCCLDV